MNHNLVSGGKTDGIYLHDTPAALLPALNQLDELNTRFVQLKSQMPPHSDLWQITLEKLRASWTYHSNAIEGSTLTLGDTIFFSEGRFDGSRQTAQGFFRCQKSCRSH